MMIDGIHLAKHLVMIAVGIDAEGHKHVLGFWEGSTENTEVCVSQVSDLVERGLDSQKSTLFVIDGGKALRKEISLVFGKRAVVQRCQIHKMRNVAGHLPKDASAKRSPNNARGLRQQDAHDRSRSTQAGTRAPQKSAPQGRVRESRCAPHSGPRAPPCDGLCLIT
ncbi:MAG: hypothetical protein GY811_29885 [Myxococcales bacterium]|nr:hypothetical protein [Myxococcales bacterium]